MSDFQEKHITLTHENKKLEAVFIRQPMTDAKQAKEYEGFLEQMHGALQKFLESSDFFQDRQDKEAKNDDVVDDIDPKEYADLYSSILPLAKEINSLKAKIKEAGGFAEDRELLECSSCGLLEDVSFDGMWLVYKKGDEQKDTGLRFIPLDNEDILFKCPVCKLEVKAPVPEEIQWD